MSFDIKQTLAGMLGAVKGVVSGEWPKVKACVEKALQDEREALEALADARLSGVIDDGILASELEDEKQTLQTVLLVCQLMGKKMAQDAANAAIDVLNKAIAAALGALVGRGRARAGRAGKIALKQRVKNVRPDTLDFRDLLYVPTLVEVGSELPLARYLEKRVPVLDQGTEGACTGFGLATVAHYLLRSRKVVSDKKAISPWMFYFMARRYDEWRGESYDGSSCRGAMKGWHKHGVCADGLWSHDARRPDLALTHARASDAQTRPLGAYFRVNHKDLVAMHAAISEVGVLYASANVHVGWDSVGRDGIIPLRDQMDGGHAFAIVAYDREGFWIQNSWGTGWGRGGFGRICYEDWLRNGSDVWVARLGAHAALPAGTQAVSESFTSSAVGKAYAYDEVRPHVVCIGNDGRLRTGGNIATPPEQVERIFTDDFPRITKAWSKPRLVLYAHGGLVDEDSAVQRVAEYRRAMLDAECYPLAFIWRTDYWTTLKNMLQDAMKLRRSEGVLDSAKDFMLDRLDDAIEPIARRLSGKAVWDEMKENALASTASPAGGARLVLGHIARLMASQPNVELHVVGHSAGSIFHGPLVRMLTANGTISGALLNGEQGLGLKVKSCTLWAPACSISFFEDAYQPAIEDKSIADFALYTLTDCAEQDDHCARIYNKSLLYLVSHAFERRARIPILRPEGEPLLGMEKHIAQSASLQKLIGKKLVLHVLAPNEIPEDQPGASKTTTHGGFDDDRATVKSTLSRVVGAAALRKKPAGPVSFASGRSRQRAIRRLVDLSTR